MPTQLQADSWPTADWNQVSETALPTGAIGEYFFVALKVFASNPITAQLLAAAPTTQACSKMSSSVGHLSFSTRSTINMASTSGRGMPFVQAPQTNGRRIRVATCGAATRPSGVSLFDAMKFNGPAPGN